MVSKEGTLRVPKVGLQVLGQAWCSVGGGRETGGREMGIGWA